MSDRFNELYRGDPGDAANHLEDQEASEQELRAALINALHRIQKLEFDMESLQEFVRNSNIQDLR
jgi:hypothetical protein